MGKILSAIGTILLSIALVGWLWSLVDPDRQPKNAAVDVTSRVSERPETQWDVGEGGHKVRYVHYDLVNREDRSVTMLRFDCAGTYTEYEQRDFAPGAQASGRLLVLNAPLQFDGSNCQPQFELRRK